MPPTRRRLSRKKKKKTARKKCLAVNGVSLQQFDAFAQEYFSFQVEDKNHDPHTFVPGNMVYIQFKESDDDDDDDGVDPTEDYWIAEIMEVRGSGPDDVWVRVQWFWSPAEVAGVIKSFNPAICGKYEKLASDNHDIISVHSIVDHVEVKQFSENDVHQVFIDEDEWFCRYQFLYDAKRIIPKVTHDACLVCKIPYTPGQVNILHFCPRPRCRKFYHQTCLLKGGYAEETRHYRLLETWPHIDRTISVHDIVNALSPAKSLIFKQSLMQDPLSGFPPPLVSLANQQIVRGTEGGGVVGNINSVAAARLIIFRALEIGDHKGPDDWETRVDVSLVSAEMLTFPNCICPSCLSPI